MKRPALFVVISISLLIALALAFFYTSQRRNKYHRTDRATRYDRRRRLVLSELTNAKAVTPGNMTPGWDQTTNWQCRKRQRRQCWEILRGRSLTITA